MSNAKILFISSQVTPYLPENNISLISRYLPQAMQEMGSEIRLFMPKYGCINERRNQLHEVIRLSGMNLIIDDTDHQLIIKVASIPAARVQVYFIDNEDFFQRKAVVADECGVLFGDNDERAIFFARGVLETVKKLRWSPNVVHCHGWLSAIAPLYLRKVFKDDPIFSKVKIVISLYNDGFQGMMNEKVKEKIKQEGIKASGLSFLDEPTYVNLMKFALTYADGVVFAEQGVDAKLVEFVAQRGIPVLDAVAGYSEVVGASGVDEGVVASVQDAIGVYSMDSYAKFYEEILEK